MKTNSLTLCGSLIMAGASCEQRPKTESVAPHENIESGTPQQKYVQFHADNFYRAAAFDLTQSYRVGMSRDAVRRILGADQLVSSLACPARGWRRLEKDDYGVGGPASEFESDH